MSLPAPAPVPSRPTTAEDLPDDPATLKRMILELLATLQEHQRDKEALRHRLDLLLRRLYGPRSERFDPNQPLLFAELSADPDASATPPPEPAPEAKPKRRARPHGRRRLPANLRREPRHHVLTEAERVCPGCGGLRVDIGVDKSEQLDYLPASLFVIEHFVHKYVCPCCSQCAPASPQPPQAPESPALTTQPPQPQPTPPTPADTPSQPPGPPEAPSEPGAAQPAPAQPALRSTAPLAESTQAPAEETAPRPEPLVEVPASSPSPPSGCGPIGKVVLAAAKPAQPVAKGLPGPGLLAHLIVSKFVDHLPLYRLERIYERQGLFIPRSTLCDWLAACAQLLRPLYQWLVTLVLQSRVLHTDDTPVNMQEPVTHQLSTARLWGYLGDAAHPYNVFDFTRNHKRDGPQTFLEKYQGYLQADAFSGYDGLYLPDPRTATARIIEVACNAHARRKFHEARGSAALASHQALAYYRQLYELERQAVDFTEAQRLQMRQDLAVPILNQFRAWLEAQRAQALPKSPLAEAVGYALNHWSALVRYTEAGFLSIDNNAAEREMKRIAIGRKNWLFVGSPQGGQTAAMLFTFTSTCQRLRVEPWAYLQDVLTRLPTTPTDQLGALVPDRWQAEREAKAAAASPASTDESTP